MRFLSHLHQNRGALDRHDHARTGVGSSGGTPNSPVRATRSALRPRLEALPFATTLRRCPGLTAVVTGRAVRYPVKISEVSPFSIRRRGSGDKGERPEEVGVVRGQPTARHEENYGRSDGGVRRPAPNQGWKGR